MFNQGLRISNKEYREKEGISSSDLKKIVKSPAHFRYWKDNPQEDTPALLFGRAAHKYMLEPNDFFTEFEVAKDFKYGTKLDKEETQNFICKKAIEVGRGEEWDNFITKNPKKEDVIAFYRSLLKGKDIITAEEFEKIKEMHKALYSTEFVADLLSGEKELSFFAVDDDTLLPLKCRPDCLSIVKGTNILVDYKTCNDAENMRFYRDSVKLNYDLQMAYYLDILKKVTGEDFLVVILAQEKSAPYAVNVFELSEQYLESGREVYREMLKVYAECEKSGNWYGYMKNGISTLGMPDDEEMEEE